MTLEDDTRSNSLSSSSEVSHSAVVVVKGRRREFVKTTTTRRRTRSVHRCRCTVVRAFFAVIAVIPSITTTTTSTTALLATPFLQSAPITFRRKESGGLFLGRDDHYRLSMADGRRNVDVESTSSKKNWHSFHNDTVTSFPPTAAWSEDQYQNGLLLYQTLQCDPLAQKALLIISDAYRIYGGPLNVIGSYNGGKDAVVILHLMRAAHAHHYHCSSTAAQRTRPRVIYFEHEQEFPQVWQLLQDTVHGYDLDMLSFPPGIKFSEGLTALTNRQRLAFILGSRLTDPNARSQGHYTPSSSYMPPFLRVNPILEWTYGDVWHFLKTFRLPYCSLYDEGYTSLGTVLNTRPCPALAKNDGAGYWPAHMLHDWTQERAGRVPKSTADTNDITISSNASVASSILYNSSTTAEENTSTKTIVPPTKETQQQQQQMTVGLLIIGDEILKGLTPDINTHAAALALRAHSVPLVRVVVVSDDLEEISAEIRHLQLLVDIIITSGGVGPTHDDVTIKSVGAALQVDMVTNMEMAQFLQTRMKNDNNEEAQKKMSTLPSGSQLLYLTDGEWPILTCQNIYVLPGIPQYFETKVRALASYLSFTRVKSATYKVLLRREETSIVSVLNQVVKRHPHVTFGSYPFVNDDSANDKTIITLEGRRRSQQQQSTTTNNKGRDTERTCFTKEEMDRNVEDALADLVNQIPGVVRVDSNDDLTRCCE